MRAAIVRPVRRALSSSRIVRNVNDAKKYGQSFGFKAVKEEERQGKVNEVFDNVAEKYDIMNDVMSVGIHRVWKDWFVARLNPKPGSNILDGAGGTGDIAFRMLDYVHLGCYQTASHMAGADHIAANTTIPIGKPLFTIGQGLNHFGLLEPARSVVSNIPIFGESFQNHSTADTSLTVTIADINKNMLSVGERRAVKSDRKFVRFHEDEEVEPVFLRNQQELYFKEMNLEEIDQQEEENSFDYFTIAFGIRNCTNIDKVLEQGYKCLKPGGKLQILEFSHVSLSPLDQIYNEYSFKFIPVFGEIITGDYDSYKYLVESIRKFPKQEEFLGMIEQAGFERCEYENLSGGICAIHSGYKPLVES